jgi:hypothetical protein
MRINAQCLILAAALVTVAAYAPVARADCPDGYRQVGERQEETADAIIIHPICQQIAAPTPVPVVPHARQRLVNAIDGLDAMAKESNWDAKKLNRFDATMASLPLSPDFTAPSQDVTGVWATMRKRAQDPVLVKEAAATAGPDLVSVSAGQQTHYTDCTIFALASASGQPYEVVAAKATAMISDANWRPQEERNAAQHTIEHGGLNGDEVAFLAETAGQTHTVTPANFASALRSGTPLLLDVALPPRPNRDDIQHEVVLSKAFQHNGQTWYEMIDSNQGPVRRLYLSTPELQTIVRENAVAFVHDPGTTPQLFH